MHLKKNLKNLSKGRLVRDPCDAPWVPEERAEARRFRTSEGRRGQAPGGEGALKGGTRGGPQEASDGGAACAAARGGAA